MSKEAEKTRVKLKICGSQFIITADESTQYIQKIAKMVDDRIKAIDDSDEKLSLHMSTIVAALNYCDQLEKERVITRELIKKTDECEAIAKEATVKLNQLMIENAQLKEEKAGLHRVISELKAGIYTEENNQNEQNQYISSVEDAQESIIEEQPQQYVQQEQYIPQEFPIKEDFINTQSVQQEQNIPQGQPIQQEQNIPQSQPIQQEQYIPQAQSVQQEVQKPKPFRPISKSSINATAVNTPAQQEQYIPQTQPVQQEVQELKPFRPVRQSAVSTNTSNNMPSEQVLGNMKTTPNKINSVKPRSAFRPVSPSKSGMASNIPNSFSDQLYSHEKLANIVTDEEISNLRKGKGKR